MRQSRATQPNYSLTFVEFLQNVARATLSCCRGVFNVHKPVALRTAVLPLIQRTTRRGGIACWLERRTLGRKVASSNPGRSGGRMFFSRLQSQLCVLTLIRCPFQPRVTAVARKRPRSFCQKCRFQVTPKYAYTFDPSKSEWADYAVVLAECGNLSGNELTCKSSGNNRSQSLQPAEPL